MSLIKREFPFANWSSMFEDDFFKKNLDEKWAPAVNVLNEENAYKIELAAPGFKKEDITLEVDNGVLFVEGKSRSELEEKEKNYTRKEFSSRSFSRTLNLPEHVDKEDIDAKFEDGVLYIEMKKLRIEPKSKQVLIK
jgi:HSP20 family protein